MTPTTAPGAAVPRDLLQDSTADILNADDVANTICFLPGPPSAGEAGDRRRARRRCDFFDGPCLEIDGQSDWRKVL
jgi:hypothetical protein